MFTPQSRAGSFVVDTRKELESLWRDLLRGDPELLIQLALRRALHTLCRSLQIRTGLARDTQRVRAAGVGPLPYPRH